jgi:hypothetical protein
MPEARTVPGDLHRSRGCWVSRPPPGDDLGVAIFARSPVPDDLIELPPQVGSPDLGEIDLVPLTNPRSPTKPAEALTTAILASGHPGKRCPA